MEALQLLNHIGNHPDVLPALAPGHRRVPYELFFQRRGNTMFGDERGVVLFFDKGNGAYAGHYLLTKALRGKEALLFCQKCLSAMFTEHGARVIYGTVPRENRASCAMTRALGFRRVGTSTDTQGRACFNYVLERATHGRYSR